MISTGVFNVSPGEVEEASAPSRIRTRDRVSPGEVEEALVAQPSVRAAAVVDKPREDGTETVVAAVELSAGTPSLNEEGVKNVARERLSRHKVPREFSVVEELPMNIIGKTLRRAARGRPAGHRLAVLGLSYVDVGFLYS